MLTDLITKDTFQCFDKQVTWKEAIRKLANPLIDNNSIQEGYVDEVIKKVEELGPFINLGKGIAIPHARPEDGVNKTSMGLLILKHPTYLLDQDDQDVTVLFMIAAKNNISHLEALQELTIFLREDRNIEKLKNLSSYEEFVKLFNKKKGR